MGYQTHLPNGEGVCVCVAAESKSRDSVNPYSITSTTDIKLTIDRTNGGRLNDDVIDYPARHEEIGKKDEGEDDHGRRRLDKRGLLQTDVGNRQHSERDAVEHFQRLHLRAQDGKERSYFRRIYLRGYAHESGAKYIFLPWLTCISDGTLPADINTLIIAHSGHVVLIERGGDTLGAL